MALGIVGPALSILQMRPPCIRSLVPEVLLLSILAKRLDLPGPLDFHPPFCIKCCYTPYIEGLWDLSSPALPCQCVAGGTLTVNPVFTFTVIFLAPIMYFTVCTFCISIKMKMEMPIWLFRK